MCNYIRCMCPHASIARCWYYKGHKLIDSRLCSNKNINNYINFDEKLFIYAADVKSLPWWSDTWLKLQVWCGLICKSLTELVTVTCQCHMSDKQTKKQSWLKGFWSKSFQLWRELEYTSNPRHVQMIKNLTQLKQWQKSTKRFDLIDFTYQWRYLGRCGSTQFWPLRVTVHQLLR